MSNFMWVEIKNVQDLKIGRETLRIYADGSQDYLGKLERIGDDYLYFENCHTDPPLFGTKFYQRPCEV
ncbi:hypothetical protein N8Z24_00575 [bacterium]|nr:hypothetical protein [bacterium]